MSYFIDHEDSIYNYKPEVFQTRRSTVTVSNTTTKGKIAEKLYTIVSVTEKH